MGGGKIRRLLLQMQNLTGQLVKKSRAIEKLKQGNAFLKDRCQIAETSAHRNLRGIFLIETLF